MDSVWIMEQLQFIRPVLFIGRIFDIYEECFTNHCAWIGIKFASHPKVPMVFFRKTS